MKKMILLGVFALVLIATTSVGANESMKNERAEKNVEALKDGTVLTPVGGQGDEGTATPCGGPKTNGECESRNTVNCKDLSGCQ